MKTFQKILMETMRLTTTIETNYPELYIYLDENPITLSTDNNPEIDIKSMKDYLETLKQLLKHHIEAYKMKQ